MLFYIKMFFEQEQQLRDLYYSPKFGFKSGEKFYEEVQKQRINLSRAAVKKWLREQKSYQLFKHPKKIKKFRVTFVDHIGQQIQLDLIDMAKYEKANDGYRWILAGIDVLSRFAFCVPSLRKDKTHMEVAITEVLDDAQERFKRYPRVVQFDDGKEFYNNNVKKVLSSHNIEWFSTKSEKKAALVERFNRTLKSMMWKYFYVNDTQRWLEVLPELVENYNYTKHTTIGMEPASVNSKNQKAVWSKLYGDQFGDYVQPKFKEGDKVRIKKYKKRFAKGYEKTFTDEIFTIKAVIGNDPTVYKIEDNNKEEIIGTFYTEELVAAS